MRSELISGELFTRPCSISANSKRIHVACGSHILSYNLKSGRIADSTEALMSTTSDLVSSGENVIVSDATDSKIVLFKNGGGVSVTQIAGWKVVGARDNLLVVTKPSSETGEVVLGYFEGTDFSESNMVTIFTGVVYAVSCSRSMIAFVSGSNRLTLTVFDVSTKSRKDYGHNLALTCTAIHPTESQVAAGDSEGRIVRWTDDSVRYSSVHHWHSVPVSCLAYSSSGSMLLSGAEEGVLCLWTESSSASKPQFIPRLGGPIVQLCVSRCNQFAAVSIRSNKIVVVDLFTRSIQSTIHGSLTDLDSGNKRGASVRSVMTGDDRSLVSISTASHVQIFDIESRRGLTMTPICVQERNYVPTSLKARMKARPWECNHVRVAPSSTNGGDWFMMTSLERKRKHSPGGEAMIKIFSSKDGGLNWKLHTLCMGAHLDSLVGISWCAPQETFLTASRDGTVKVWKLSQETSTWTIVKTIAFKDLIPSHISVTLEGLVIIGFDKFVTLWDPSTMCELTRTGLALDSKVVFAGLVEDNPLKMFALSVSGQVSLWDLKTLSVIKSVKAIKGRSRAVCVRGDRLLIGFDGAVVSVSDNSHSLGELLIEHIVVTTHPLDEKKRIGSILPVNGGVAVACEGGASIYRIHMEATTVADSEVMGPLRTHNDADESRAMEDDDVETTEETPNERRTPAAPRVLAPTTGKIIQKLFPLENSLDTVGSPEDQFIRLIGSLLKQ